MCRSSISTEENHTYFLLLWRFHEIKCLARCASLMKVSAYHSLSDLEMEVVSSYAFKMFILMDILEQL